jgi:hypothetical protein
VLIRACCGLVENVGGETSIKEGINERELARRSIRASVSHASVGNRGFDSESVPLPAVVLGDQLTGGMPQPGVPGGIPGLVRCFICGTS